MSFNQDNSNKAQFGANNKKNLAETLQYCHSQKMIKEFNTAYSCGYDEYGIKQFSANFLIVHLNDEMWVLFTTTTFRSDRFKGNQWDAENIKRINPSVTKAFLIYSDDVAGKELDIFLKEKKKLEEKLYYSSFDGILSLSELYTKIENLSISTKTSGQAKDFLGNNFEKHLCDILNNKDNLSIHLNKTTLSYGKMYWLFKDIIDRLEVNTDSLQSLEATNDKKLIGLLPTGGSPKTDVLIKLSYPDKDIYKTISCKRTSSKKISVHQYNYQAFSNALDPQNTKLRDLLYKFQKAGGIKAFGEENTAALTEELTPYINKLIMWSLGGYYGEFSSEKQLANYILTMTDNVDNAPSYKIYTLEEYRDLLLSFLKDTKISGQLGTPFSWTYASGQLGKSIQLKLPII